MAEGPYTLPNGWHWVRLGEVCEINPKRPRLIREDHAPTSFVPMNAVNEITGTIVDLQVRPFSEVRNGYRYFQEGDVLFAKITPCMENGKSAITRDLIDGFGFGSTEFHVLRPGREVTSEWVWFFVRQERFRLEAKATFRGGVGQQRVPQEFLGNYLIPLPPREEQRRIVARVEELMERVREAKRLREQTKDDTKRLWQATLAEVFPKPGAELPPDWRWVKLGEVCELERATLDPRKHPQSVFYLYSIPAYDLYQRPERLNGSQIGSSKLVIGPNVCLFSKLNPRIPRAWVVAEVPKDGIPVASTEFMPLRPKTDVLDLVYLGKVLMTEEFLSQLRSDVTGATGSRQRLRPETVLNAKIPLPPLKEQCRIVVHLEAVQEKLGALRAAQTETAAALQRLEQAILDKAFRGEL